VIVSAELDELILLLKKAFQMTRTGVPLIHRLQAALPQHRSSLVTEKNSTESSIRHVSLTTSMLTQLRDPVANAGYFLRGFNANGSD
jgi:hypothetical protein